MVAEAGGHLGLAAILDLKIGKNDISA